MPSTYSDLKVELISTGEQSGSWGDTTNTNLGTALEEAIVGRANADFPSDADLTITLTNTNATQVARNYILNVTSSVSLSTTRNLIVPTIDKPYIVENNTTGGQSIVVKTSAGTGVTVPNGKTMMVYVNSTNVVPAFSNLPAGTTIDGTTPGDVTGPALATDNAVVRFDGITGKLVQNSAVTITDDGATVISTNSSSDALRITQTGAGNALVVEDSANPDSTPFVVDTIGRVITGATQPYATVVVSSVATPHVQQHGTSSTSTAVTGLYAWNNANAYYTFNKAAAGGIGTYASVTNGSALGTIQFNGADGANFVGAALITAAVDGTPGINDMPGRLVFSTTSDGASSPTERMRIDSNGLVTLATALPVSSGGTGQTSYTDGQLLIGNSSGNTLTKATLTAGSNITITNGNGSITIAAASSGGDVVGPASSVSGNIATFNGTTGKLIQDSGKATPTGDVVGTTDTQTLSNKTLIAPVALASTTTTQDGVILTGRAGGTNSFRVTIVPTTLSQNRTLTLPNVTGTAVLDVATQTLTNKTIEAGTFTNGYTEETVSANTGTAYTIDLLNGSVQILTLTGNCTFTFPTATAGRGFTLILEQDATGSRTVTWPASVKWPSNIAPTITATALKADKYVFVADGTNWIGSNAGQNYTV